MEAQNWQKNDKDLAEHLCYNPNMKALYFTKVRPSVSKAINYKKQALTKLSSVKYVPDKSAKLTPIMKEALSEQKFIKKLASKYDALVQYLGEVVEFRTYRGETTSVFKSTAFVYAVNPQNKDMDCYCFSETDCYTPEGARVRLLDSISKGVYSTKNCFKCYDLEPEEIE